MGGAYEWTSTLFAPQSGFKPMDIYPEYSGKYIYSYYQFSDKLTSYYL